MLRIAYILRVEDCPRLVFNPCHGKANLFLPHLQSLVQCEGPLLMGANLLYIIKGHIGDHVIYRRILESFPAPISQCILCKGVLFMEAGDSRDCSIIGHL